MGRWKLTGHSQVGAGGMMATVALRQEQTGWAVRATEHVRPYSSADPDTARIWWSDTGVHQNLTFPVHPDPISGMHCWHQAVRVRPAGPGDAHGDIAVDTAKAREVYHRWMTQTRPAGHVSPDVSSQPQYGCTFGGHALMSVGALPTAQPACAARKNVWPGKLGPSMFEK